MGANCYVEQNGTSKGESKGNRKWGGSVQGLVDAPIDKVWLMVSQSSRLPEWMPMVEGCTDLAGEEGVPGYIRLVSGFMFPQEDGDRSWIKERLISFDNSSFTYTYKMEAGNVGLDGSVNSIKLMDYGEDSTLVEWTFEIDPLENAYEENIIDYLGFIYRSFIQRIGVAIKTSSANLE
ncbi:hypothetical protein Leryth_019645 [Lithospermum erythrorhizon]|nr:hypothetical protein Leryth_019645 [Lithospermum erythrorhizon]